MMQDKFNYTNMVNTNHIETNTLLTITSLMKAKFVLRSKIVMHKYFKVITN